MSESLRTIGVVVIGRNEGERLRLCLVAAKCDCNRLIYADSGSTDSSISIAQSLGAHVVIVEPPALTAARGRQEGFERLLQLWPAVEYVQFIDGDCELQEGWIVQAIKELDENPKTAAVSGIRSEAFKAENIWSRLVDIEWPRAEGHVQYPGGDSLCRVSALREIGGWSTHLIAGEDPDLGFRLDQAGWQVHRLATPMTLHDIRITKFSQYWCRAVRSGWAYALAGWRNRRNVGFAYYCQGLKFTLHALALLVTSLASVFYWPSLTLFLLLLGWITWRAGRFARSKGLSTLDSLLYAVLVIPVRFAQARGFLGAMISIARGLNANIIEYHSAPKHAESCSR